MNDVSNKFSNQVCHTYYTNLTSAVMTRLKNHFNVKESGQALQLCVFDYIEQIIEKPKEVKP